MMRQDQHRAMRFVGVDTERSSIRQLFPLLAQDLGLGGAHLRGQDLPIGAGTDHYRQAVRDIASDPHVRGALVTTHKVDIYTAAHDLFATLDPYAVLTGEVSCIAKDEERLTGHAKDPVTAGQTLDTMLAPNHFASSGGQVLCLGAGGAGLAILLHLLNRDARHDPPPTVLATDVDAARLTAAHTLAKKVGNPGALRCVLTEDASALLEQMPPASLVINATGLGKDRTGSPVRPDARFPPGAVVWDFNYRGDLTFLRQARKQANARQLRIEDGWRYFVNGWVEHTAHVFGQPLDDTLRQRLHTTADQWRAGEQA